MEILVLSLFVTFFLYWDFNLPFRVKRLFRIPYTKNIRIVDCFPCFTFWTTIVIVLINQNISLWFIPMATYLIAKIYEKSIRN